jgi:hypothetical protein
MAANAIDPEHAGSVTTAALAGGLGGWAAKLHFSTKNLNTLLQARYFAPTTFRGLLGSPNARSNMASFSTASAVGSAAYFGW